MTTPKTATGGQPGPPPDPNSAAGQAHGHAQKARYWLDRLDGTPAKPEDWERTRTMALVSIAESLATIAANQPQQIKAD